MPLWKIAYRSIQFRSVSSILTAFSMSLGVAIVVTVIVIHGVLHDSFNKGTQGYDLIIAAKGSPLDVVLSTVFYLREPVGEVPAHYLRVFQGREELVIENETFRFPRTFDAQIPVNIGHQFRGAPIIGTVPEFFTRLTYMGDRPYRFVSPGHNIGFMPEDDFTAVIGSRASRRTGLRVGDTFEPEGIDEGDDHHKPFKIVGVLEPTGTPNDNAIFVNIRGFYDMHGHGIASGATERYSAILLRAREQVSRPASAMVADPNNPAAMLADRTFIDTASMELPRILERTHDIQAVSPIREISALLENIVGNVQLVLLVLAILVVIVAGIGMMVSIYNSMSERRQEIALMRALGARRLTVMIIILLESILLSLGGGVFGVFLGHLLIAGIGPLISEHTGIVVRFWDFQLAEIILIPGLIVLATLVGLLPAAVAYKQDVATSLAP